MTGFLVLAALVAAAMVALLIVLVQGMRRLDQILARLNARSKR